MTQYEKEIEIIIDELKTMPKWMVYMLCANLIYIAEPEKFIWKELKAELDNCNKTGK